MDESQQPQEISPGLLAVGVDDVAARTDDVGTGGKAFVIFCTRSVQAFLTNNTMQMAAAIAFYSFFSLFPLFFLTLISFDAFTNRQSQVDQLTTILGTFIPVSRQVIADSLNSATQSRAATGPIAVIGLVWASTAVFSCLRKGINTAWSVFKPRPFLKERLIDLALTGGAGFALVVMLLGSSILRSYAEDTKVTSPSIISGPVWLSALSFASTFMVLTVLYRFLPNRRVQTRNVLFGALVATIAFEIGKGAFFAYTQTRGDVNQVYGSLTAVVILLAWLYFSAVILLIGALIGAIYTQVVERGIVSPLAIWSLGAVPGAKHLRREWLPRLAARLRGKALPTKPEKPVESATHPR
ncbi:MAG: YihY/virulence factor BrkB family protein [Chloroflexi bacterium]|nr:YihY/virulence factor BrkB family protein [Chloroflexota bacterium]